MIGMESLEVTTNGRGSDHNPLTGLLPFLMLMGDVALLSVTLLGHGTIGHFHCGIVGEGLSHESAARHRPVRPFAWKGRRSGEQLASLCQGYSNLIQLCDALTDPNLGKGGPTDLHRRHRRVGHDGLARIGP